MSQQEILKILSKNWQTRTDIHNKLKNKTGMGSITKNLKQIRKYKLAKYKTIIIQNKKTKVKQPTYVYKKSEPAWS